MEHHWWTITTCVIGLSLTVLLLLDHVSPWVKPLAVIFCPIGAVLLFATITQTTLP